MKHEEQHNDIRERLKKLPKLKARDGFENELLRRINLIETPSSKESASKKGLWEILFGKRSLVWTIPATATAVIGVVVLAVYFNLFRTDDKVQFSSQQTVDSQKTKLAEDSPRSETTTKSSIPGKDIANDLEIGKTPAPENRNEINKGFTENYITRNPKGVNPSEKNVIDSKKGTTEPENAYEVGKTGVNPAPIEKAVEKNDIKEEKKVENNLKGLEEEKKISAPLIKDSDKVKKNDKVKDEIKAKEERKKKKSPVLTKEILEKLKQEIIDK